MSLIHPTAIVAAGATIEDGARIGPWCQVGASVTIGAGAELMSHVVVDGVTRIGRQAVLFPFCTVGLAPQDLKYKGEPTRCDIGARTHIREHCTIHRGTVTGHGVTRLGNDNYLLAYTHVGHDCILGNNIVLSNLVMLGGHVELGDWVTMSGYAGAHQFVKIGAHAFIGNMTAVTRDVPPYVLAAGQPAEPRSINAVGLQRRGFSPEQVRNIKAAYRILYRSDLKLDDAVERLTELAAEQPELRIFVDFIGTATRSLVR